jgi:hypothetical protein
MARTTTCERQLLRAASDAGFRIVPPMVRLLWYELLAFAAAAPEKGRLRFLQSVSGSVSRLLSIPETDVETGLETLAALGLVEHDLATYSLWMPGARANSARKEAAQNNGLRGGRPKKGESAEQAYERRQGHMVLPITGGLQETQETKAEPKPESSRAVLTESPLGEKVSTAHETAAWVSLGQKLAEIARLDPARGGHSFHVVRSWLALPGASEDRLCEAVRKVAARPKYDPRTQRISLEYFTAAVREHLDRARATKGDGFDPTSMQDETLRRAKEAWALNPVGPMPRRAA